MAILIDENGDVIDPIHSGEAKRTFEINGDENLEMLVVRTEWPNEIEIIEVNDGTIIAQADTVDERHEACKWLAKQGWEANVTRSRIRTQMTLTVPDQADPKPPTEEFANGQLASVYDILPDEMITATLRACTITADEAGVDDLAETLDAMQAVADDDPRYAPDDDNVVYEGTRCYVLNSDDTPAGLDGLMDGAGVKDQSKYRTCIRVIHRTADLGRSTRVWKDSDPIVLVR
ncbi:hypothetical protein [Natronorubrum sp. FCH18a]|uniref:hypothetical protein n=1 Tax=Natronorubrum sp. FCH18a TaxID=3447018 RepID=UPI003F519F6E